VPWEAPSFTTGRRSRTFVPAARSVIAGEYSLPIVLLTIGGSGMATGAIFRSIRTDPEEFTLPAARLLLLIALAGFSVLVTVISTA